MSDKDKNNPFEEIQNQIQDAIQHGRIQFGIPTDFQPSLGQTASEEKSEDPDNSRELLERIREFNLKPREIRDYLNRFVIKQDEAKKVLSVAICDHYNHVRSCLENPSLLDKDYYKQNILLLGPTGVGKTYLLRCISKLIGVPFVKADATKFSETGYVGYDVEDLVRDLVKMANGDTELAQYGIVYIDEIDKIAGSMNQHGGKDVSGRGVQINLLKLMEDAEVNLFSPTDMMSQMQAVMDVGKKKRKRSINTRHILFIVSGAFDKLGDAVKKRIGDNSIGFSNGNQYEEKPSHEYLKQVNTADFIKYGFEPEFIGRLPVRVACNPLETEDLENILTQSEGSLLEQYKQDFKGYEMDFKITPEAIRAIANEAHQEKTGARGLMTVFERIFRNFKFELPSTAIKNFEVKSETVADPESTLRALLIENQHLQSAVLKKDIQAFAQRFLEKHQLTLVFDDSGCKQLIKESVDKDITIRSLCEAKFRDYEHGLKIISRNLDQSQFVVNADMVKDPDGIISDMVVSSFKQKEEKSSSENASDEGKE